MFARSPRSTAPEHSVLRISILFESSISAYFGYTRIKNKPNSSKTCVSHFGHKRERKCNCSLFQALCYEYRARMRICSGSPRWRIGYAGLHVRLRTRCLQVRHVKMQTQEKVAFLELAFAVASSIFSRTYACS